MANKAGIAALLDVSRPSTERAEFQQSQEAQEARQKESPSEANER